MVAIDTNVAVTYFKNELQLPVGIRITDFVLPVIVAGEMLFGAKNSGRPEANLLTYRKFINNPPLLLLDGLAAEHYAEIRLALKTKAAQFLKTTCGLPPSAAPTTCRCSLSTGTLLKLRTCRSSRFSARPAPVPPGR